MIGAATKWIKYDKDSIGSPKPYEWCLWSLVINGSRNYFGSMLIEQYGERFVQWDGLAAFDIDDSLYFARVIKMCSDHRIL